MKTETISDVCELIGIARRQLEEAEQIGDIVPRSAWEDLWAARKYAAQARRAWRFCRNVYAAYLGAAMERIQRLEGLYQV